MSTELPSHPELRAYHGRVHYRILYIFHGRHRVVLTSGLTRKDGCPRPKSSWH